MYYRLSDRVIAELRQQAQAGAPQEVCGFAFGGSHEGYLEFYTSTRVPNISADPTQEFLINGHLFRHAALLAERAHLILALWHSHPVTRPTPSKEDFALIVQLATIPFIIVGVSQPVITIYECEDGRAREAERLTFGEYAHAGT